MLSWQSFFCPIILFIMNESWRGRILLALAALLLGWTLAAFGSSTIEYRKFAAAGLALLAILAIATLPRSHRFPQLPKWTWFSLGFLLLWASFMAWNAHSDHDREIWVFTDFLNRPFEGAPGAVAYSDAQYFTLEFAGVMMGFFAVARCVESKAWIVLLQLFAGAGLAVTFVALGHKILGMKTVWGLTATAEQAAEGIVVVHPETFFAPYIYNANAAAFLNLVFPISLALALRAWRNERPISTIFFWALAGFVSAAGVIATASKGGFLILLFCLFLILLLEWQTLRTLIKRRRSGAPLGLEAKVGFFAGLAIVIGFMAMGTRHLFSRWSTLVETLSANEQSGSVHSRVEMMKKLIEMGSPSEGSWHGFGPGAFPHLLPYFNPENNSALLGAWHRGHSDPLQTIVEWGYLGFVAWFSLGAGAIIAALVMLKQSRISAPNAHLVKALLVGLLGVGAHSCFDFPLSIFSIHVIALTYCAILLSLHKQTSSL